MLTVTIVYGVVLAVSLGIIFAFFMKEKDYERDDQRPFNSRWSGLGLRNHQRKRRTIHFTHISPDRSVAVGGKTMKCIECEKTYQFEETKANKPLRFCSTACEKNYWGRP